jgi:hypothetical protein
MKKIIIGLSIAIMTFSSCSDFLEEENKSNVTTSQYLTASGYETLVNANYSQLREIYGSQPWLFVAGTDLYASGRNLQPVGLSQYTQLSPSDANSSYLFNQCYIAIQRANTALYYADLTAKTTTLPTRVAEVKFLRANAYFLLVQTYGGVAITKYNPEPINFTERNTAEEVYNLIIKDLEESLAVLTTGTYNGRVTKRAVNDLLAKVHLTRGYETFGKATDFATAATYADAAIAGQALTIKSGQLWLPINDVNPEVIFSVQFGPGSVATDVQNIGNAQGGFFGPYLGGTDVAGKAPWRSYTLCPTKYALDLYEKDDQRWEGTFMIETYTRYYDYYDIADKTGLKVTHFYEPKWFTAAERAAYIASHKDLGKIVAPATTPPGFHRYGTYAAAKGLSSDFQTIPLRKFDDPKAPYSTTTSGRVSTRDLITQRLADTYLIASEAYFKAGNSPTGLARLNVVRARAGTIAATAGQFNMDYILDERAREMMGEYNRWFDLKRTGKLIERTSLYNYEVKAANFDGANGAKKILRPIPQDALDLNQNKNFPQNPAY